MNHLIDFFIEAYYSTPAIYILLEFIAFVFGIVSVVYAKRAHILVYPSGLVATIISVFLLYKAGFFGDMMMNFYYSVMSVYGWWNWARKKDNVPVLAISRTTINEKSVGVLMFFLGFINAIFVGFAIPMSMSWPTPIATSTSAASRYTRWSRCCSARTICCLPSR